MLTRRKRCVITQLWLSRKGRGAGGGVREEGEEEEKEEEDTKGMMKPKQEERS
jgi:hypothetical protein